MLGAAAAAAAALWNPNSNLSPSRACQCCRPWPPCCLPVLATPGLQGPRLWPVQVGVRGTTRARRTAAQRAVPLQPAAHHDGAPRRLPASFPRLLGSCRADLQPLHACAGGWEAGWRWRLALWAEPAAAPRHLPPTASLPPCSSARAPPCSHATSGTRRRTSGLACGRTTSSPAARGWSGAATSRPPRCGRGAGAHASVSLCCRSTGLP